MRGENRTIANVTRRNSLFLSAAAQNNHPQLTRLYKYFEENWEIILEIDAADPFIADYLSDYNHMNQLVELINQSDLGIKNIKIESEKIKDENLEFYRDLTETISRHYQRVGKSPPTESLLQKMRDSKKIKFIHAATEGSVRDFDYSLESKGTRTLISLLIPALEALSDGSLFVIDELDTSLHPDLTRAFVSLFSKRESNPNGAQLIFSTHDVALLGTELIRQDEIWITDKDHEGASTFTPLTDFKLRSRVDFEKAYRNGRFGGVPSTNEFLSFADQTARRTERNTS